MASEHLVQLFDEMESRVEGVASFLHRGWRAGASCAMGSRTPALYREHVGTIVKRLSKLGRLNVYGEMVDILAEQGRMDVAQELEMLWNRLAAEESLVTI